ncbi:restriction endonuclease subunit S, partial [Lactococcus petauri]|uniref:restriction endonuclease subunit S n=1 Tax=Lactococcus petauri TaxID=1940789 RepID=UPI001F56D52C
MIQLEFELDIPASWELTKLRNIGFIISGGTPKSSEPSFYNGDITWITPADMGKQQDNVYFGTSNKHITEKGLTSSSAQIIPTNSIVFSSRAPIGHINIVKKEYTTNQGCKSIFPVLVDIEFIYWLLKNRTSDIQKRASGTTFKEISGSGFGDTVICIPPLSEQKRISQKIAELFEKANYYSSRYKELQKLDKEFPEKLRKSILQYAMQGKLVPQDPNDEPVEVLL